MTTRFFPARFAVTMMLVFLNLTAAIEAKESAKPEGQVVDNFNCLNCRKYLDWPGRPPIGANGIHFSRLS